jgi:hypothetical protein
MNLDDCKYCIKRVKEENWQISCCQEGCETVPRHIPATQTYRYIKTLLEKDKNNANL